MEADPCILKTPPLLWKPDIVPNDHEEAWASEADGPAIASRLGQHEPGDSGQARGLVVTRSNDTHIGAVPMGLDQTTRGAWHAVASREDGWPCAVQGTRRSDHVLLNCASGSASPPWRPGRRPGPARPPRCPLCLCGPRPARPLLTHHRGASVFRPRTGAVSSEVSETFPSCPRAGRAPARPRAE